MPDFGKTPQGDSVEVTWMTRGAGTIGVWKITDPSGQEHFAISLGNPADSAKMVRGVLGDRDLCEYLRLKAEQTACCSSCEQHKPCETGCNGDHADGAEHGT